MGPFSKKFLHLVLLITFVQFYTSVRFIYAQNDDFVLNTMIRETEKLHNKLLAEARFHAAFRDEYGNWQTLSKEELAKFLRVDTNAKDAIDALRVNRAKWEELQYFKKLSPKERANYIEVHKRMYPGDEFLEGLERTMPKKSDVKLVKKCVRQGGRLVAFLGTLACIEAQFVFNETYKIMEQEALKRYEECLGRKIPGLSDADIKELCRNTHLKFPLQMNKRILYVINPLKGPQEIIDERYR